MLSRIFRKRNKKGFTLIEVLIVVIVLAVLAGLAVPMYQGTVERSRRAEALGVLGSLRGAELRFFAAHNAYTNDLTQLDFNPTTVDTSGQTLHFGYAITAADATTFTATATRNAVDNGDSASTVTITQAGAVAGTGVYA